MSARRPLVAADDERHGSAAAYTYHGCRCEACRVANRARAAEMRAARAARGLPAGDPRHGTINGFTNWLCTCEACRMAGNEAKRLQRRERAVWG